MTANGHEVKEALGDPSRRCVLGGQAHAQNSACGLSDHWGEQLLTARFYALE